MSGDLTIHITKHQNGASLTFLCDSDKWVSYCMDEDVDSIIAQAKQGYMDFVFSHRIVGRTSSPSKSDG